jgi:hypothetical protein
VFRHWVRYIAVDDVHLSFLFTTESPPRSILEARLSNHQSLVGATARGVITLIS